MKIGVFDSGLGGLLILKAIHKKLPQYDYTYLGDTKRLPYGNRSRATVYEWTKQAVEYLFKHNCKLIILACNTASVQTLRRLQQEYLPRRYPGRRILGVVVPTLETAIEAGGKRVGIIGTKVTVQSKVYQKELSKRSRTLKIVPKPTPLLVPIIEETNTKLLKPALQHYLKPLLAQNINSLILACTHYAKLKYPIRAIAGKKIKVISQDEIIPAKLSNYLQRHSEINSALSQHATIELLVTELNPLYIKLAARWFAGRKPKIVQL